MRIFGKPSVDSLEKAINELRIAREKEATQYQAQIIELRAEVAILADKVRPLVASMELAWEKVNKAVKRLNFRESAAAQRAQAEEDQNHEPAAPLSRLEHLRARRARRK